MTRARGDGSLRLLRRNIYIAILFSCGIASAQTTPAAVAPAEATRTEAVARTFLDKLSAGDSAGAEASFDDTMRAGLPPEKLSAQWLKFQEQFGAFKAVDKMTVEPNPAGSAAVMTTRFARASATFKVVVNHNGQIAGFWLINSVVAPTEAAKTEAVARNFIDKVSGGNPAGTVASFDDTMRAALPPEKLSALWRKIQDQFGAFQAVDKVTVEPNTAGSAAVMITRFARASASLKIIVNPNGQIAGFWYTAAWKPPAYVTNGAFTERAISVGSNPALPGHLAIPNGKGPFPLAILVHGSGPGDEDETLGENKPFKDLALGLASKGVAVLRYDKRTHVPPPPTPITVQTEYFASVADALKLTRGNPDIDPHRIVLIGHSQGAQLAPWLARENPGLAGIALLAPLARSPLDSAIEQLEQVAAQHPDSTELAAQITALKHDRERLRSPDLRPDEVIFHAPGSYWMSLRDYDPVGTAASLSLPIFVAQGERDYNVSVTNDYPKWQRGLAKKTNVVFKRYPNLNHLFITWGGKPSVEDNAHAGHVDKQVVDDLTTWILGLPRAKGSASEVHE